MNSLKEVLQILADKLEEDKRDRSIATDGSNDLLYVLTHRLEQAYLDAAFERNSSDRYDKSFDIATVAAKKFLDGVIELNSRL